MSGASIPPACAIASWPAAGNRECVVLRLAADENFNNDIVRGLVRRKPDLDIVRVQDVGLLALGSQSWRQFTGPPRAQM